MSAATEGFSAMMSFFAMGRERPQMISANAARLQPRGATRARGRAHAREELARQARVRRPEDVFGHELAGRRLLVPENHQHDQFELLQSEIFPRSGERALDYQLAGLRGQDARMLQRKQEAATFGIELRELARRKCAEGPSRIRQRV